MFHFNQSPCIFDREPAVEGFLPFTVAPDQKRRRVCCQPFYNNAMKRDRKGIRFDVTENQQEYVLSVYKNVAEDTMSKAICDQLQKLRNDRPPTYHVVRDFFGNEYYVQDHEDDEDFMRHAIANLDLSPIKRQVARQVFRDYEITLNHRGDELVLMSRKDGLFKEFSLGIEFEDVSVKGFDMISESVAVLKIGIKKAQKEVPQMYHIEFQPSSNDTQQQEKIEQQEQQKLIEAAQEEELAKREAAATLKQRERAQAAHYAQIKKQEELARKERAALREREEQRAIEAATLRKREEQREREVAALKKHEEEERAREQEAAQREEKRRAISQKKAFLVEQKRKRRQQERQRRAKSQKNEKQPEKKNISPSDSPHNVVININFPNAVSEKTSEKSRGRSRSPVVLEDVDDEEEFRYRRSLDKSPRGSSIIDDM